MMRLLRMRRESVHSDELFVLEYKKILTLEGSIKMLPRTSKRKSTKFLQILFGSDNSKIYTFAMILSELFSEQIAFGIVPGQHFILIHLLPKSQNHFQNACSWQSGKFYGKLLTV